MLEIYRHVERSYRNIGVFGRRVLIVLTALSVVACAATFAPDFNRHGAFAQFMFMAKRAQTLILCGVLGLSMLFYGLWWKAPKKPNLMRHAFVSFVFLGASSAYYLALAQGAHYALATGLEQCAMTGCTLAWLICLQPAGEVLRQSPIPNDPERSRAIRAEWDWIVRTARALTR